MADTAISALPAATSLATSDIIPCVESAATKKTTVALILGAAGTTANYVLKANSGGTAIETGLIANANIDAAAAIDGSKVTAASGSAAGTMSSADKNKLDGIQTQGSAVAVGAMAIDWAAGTVFTKTLAAGANTFTFSNAASGMVIIVRVTGAASTLTWPTVRWTGGVAPTQTASGTDVYTFVHDGANIYGSVVQDMA